MRVVASIFVTLLFISWSTQDESDAAASSTFIEERERVARAVNEFGYKLTLKMMNEAVNKNIVISPTGVAGLLAMTLLGTAGSTYDELAKALGFSQDILANKRNHEQFGDLLQNLNDDSDFEDIPATELSSTNETLEGTNNTTLNAADIETRTLYADAIVVDAKTRLRSVYREYLDRVYHGDAIPAHFENGGTTQHMINDWVKNHTRGKIDVFLSEPLPTSTKVVLLSALYFSGQWARPFVPEFTRAMTFRRPSGDVIADLMLNLGEFNYTFKSHLDVHMIALPYNDTATTMYIMKPFSKKTSLTDLMEKLDYSLIDQLIQNLTNHECVVRFPKMDLASKVNLQNSLKEIGVKSIFAPGEANFALMVDADRKKDNDNDLLERILEDGNVTNKLRDTLDRLPNPGLYVDSVLHDVKMTINEYGTVAVAASGGFLARTARLFYADSPFYMFIRNEKTKLITFSAVIFDPTAT